MDLSEFEARATQCDPVSKTIPPPVSTPANSLTPLKVLMVQEIEPRALCILGKHSPLSYVPAKVPSLGVLSSSLTISPPGRGHLSGCA